MMAEGDDVAAREWAARRVAGVRGGLARGARPALLALALCLAACSAKGPPVKSERDQFTNFASYRSFAWLPPGREPDANLFGTRGREAVNSQLLLKGYTPVDRDPDMWVGTIVQVEEKYADSLPKYQHYAQAGGEKPLFTAYAIGYEEATLHVEIYDARTQRRIWRGSTDVAMTAKHRTDLAATGVELMFKTFPAVGGILPPEE
jgi:hypothetical protein